MRVYRPLRTEKVRGLLDRARQPAASRSLSAESLPRQLRGSLLGEALAKLPARQARATSSATCLGVANSLAVADGLSLSEPESVPRALEKAVRGIDAGLRELARTRNQPPEQVLERTAPLDLFRVAATSDASLRTPARPEERPDEEPGADGEDEPES